MIGYVTVGTKDLKRATEFFDALLAPLDAKHFMETERFVYYAGGSGALLGVTQPYDGDEACVGNGVMVAIAAESREQVDAMHKHALELGGTDEGAPGERFEGFYAGYFRDLDGNKFNVFKMG